MYNNYNLPGSPPLPDIIGQYYTPSYFGGGICAPTLCPASSHEYLFGPNTSAGYLYDPPLYAGGVIGGGGSGQPSPVRRRRYSIAGLPSATMMNDFYGIGGGFGGYPGALPPMHQSSSSNIENLLNEAHKSISRSTQILNQQARLQQAHAAPITPLSHYPGRIISSYPALHLGDTSPPYSSDNLMQMSNSFSSQPNIYFQPYTQQQQQQQQPPQLTSTQAAVAARLRPAYSVSNINYWNYPSKYAGLNTMNCNPYQQALYNQTELPMNLLQQRQLMSSLHASNPAISQLYQTQLPSTYATGAGTHPLSYNLQQQFAGTQNYPLPTSTHPSAHIHQSVQQQLNPLHQYHVHSQQNHLQTHPLAALASTSGPFGGTLTSSALAGGSGGIGGIGGIDRGSGIGATSAYDHLHSSSAYHPHHHTHYPHTHHMHHHPSASSAYHQHLTPSSHHLQHHHQMPYSKLDLDYPKLPTEPKRQVSFKFDVDTLSLDS